MKIYQKAYKICQSRFKSVSTLKELPKTFNFAKSDHTDSYLISRIDRGRTSTTLNALLAKIVIEIYFAFVHKNFH